MFQVIPANGIDIAYESVGKGPAVLMIMGIGAPMVNWPEGFYRGLAERGVRAIRFDNRDVGHSSRLAHLGVPDLNRATLRRIVGRPIRSPYRVEDMADDTVGLMDSLGIARAHIVGTSMGGMIAQTVAIRHPLRVRTLTSIMSSTGSRRDLLGSPRALAALAKTPPRDREGAIDHITELLGIIGSRTHPTPVPERRALVARCVDHGQDPEGFARQWTAILASGSRRRALRGLRTPTLVLHGTEDPLLPPRGGRAVARAVPDARLVRIEGMGHDLPRPLWPRLLDEIARHIGV